MEICFIVVVFVLLLLGLVVYMILINENYFRVLLDIDIGYMMFVIVGGF